MDQPIAYFLTWTCYGTWLHGDQRGSVDDKHDQRGAPFVPPSSRRVAARNDQLTGTPVTLDATARDAVTKAIHTVFEHRQWHLHALNVRSNHVHIVLTAQGDPPEPVMQQLKSWSTRALRPLGYSSSCWTRHGSTRYLWSQDDLANAMRYVVHGQDRKGMNEQGTRAYARGSENQ